MKRLSMLIAGPWLLLFSVLLSGCKNPPWPVDGTPDVSTLPSQAGLTLLADSDINPNESQAASPASFQVIWMSEDSKLLATDIDQLTTKKIEDVLDKNYVNHQDFTLIPGQYKYLPPVELEKETRFIGGAVYFSQPNATQWKKVIKVSPIGHRYQILIHLHKNSVDILKESED
ncbi:type VI secretion system lipoprotein TssJ [Enterobacter soli]|uniref:type VI secretion system lipoprotein TssJ n=1 Tax=Enterobacter soli TaxID=885040 RepID=UPI00325AC3BD